MWIRILLWYKVWACLLLPIHSHVPLYVSTPSNKVEQYCLLAEACIHDTIPICGKMGEETRTFLDICDLLEYVCDTNNIYIHVEDMKGCPAIKKD